MVATPLTARDDAVTITPFWQRIPKFFLFPLHAELLRKDQGYRALDVLKSLRKVQPEFELGRAAQTLPLARAAQRHGEHSYALTLMRGFERRHPRHADIPAVFLLSAQILSEHFRKNDLARLLLKQLVAKYAETAAGKEGAIYLQIMERLAKVSAAAVGVSTRSAAGSSESA